MSKVCKQDVKQKYKKSMKSNIAGLLVVLLIVSVGTFVVGCGKNNEQAMGEVETNPDIAVEQSTASHQPEENSQSRADQPSEEENGQTQADQPSEEENGQTQADQPSEEENGQTQANQLSEEAGQAAEVPIETEQSPGTVKSEGTQASLLMVGDILLHTPLAKSGLQEDGSYDFAAIFANTRDVIQAADLALVNQEVIIGGEELGVSGYPCFNAPYALGDDLAESGFDVVLHATNHALDKGRKGLENCLTYWETKHPDMEVLGIFDSEEESREISVTDVNGIRIAILNYTYGTNGIPMPDGMPYAVAMLEESRVIEDIERAETMADFTVVCPHWGVEYKLQENDNQRKWAKTMVEHGADLIIGTHPHVVEPMEWITEDAVVYYSLGNFVNWTSGTGEGVANRMLGGMAMVTLEKSDDGKISIKSANVRPVICHLEPGINGATVYFLDQYTEELADRNAIRSQDGNFSLEYCRQIAQQVFGDDCVEP